MSKSKHGATKKNAIRLPKDSPVAYALQDTPLLFARNEYDVEAGINIGEIIYGYTN